MGRAWRQDRCERSACWRFGTDAHVSWSSFIWPHAVRESYSVRPTNWLAGYIWLSTAGCRHWRLQPLHLLLAAFCKYWYGLRCHICTDFVPKLWSVDRNSGTPPLTRNTLSYLQLKGVSTFRSPTDSTKQWLSHSGERKISVLNLKHERNEALTKHFADFLFPFAIWRSTLCVRRFSGFEDIEWIFSFLLIVDMGRDSSVGIATGYGLDGRDIESRWRRDFPHLSRPALGPTQPPIQWVPGHSRG